MPTKSTRAQARSQAEFLKKATVVDNDTGRIEDEVPNERRGFVAFIVGAASGLMTGTMVMKITAYAIIGAVMLGTGGFIATCIWLLGLIAAVYYGLKSFGMAFDYIAKERIDRDLVAAKQWLGLKYTKVTDMFSRKTMEAAA